MTNNEAIKQLKERYDIGQKEYLNFAPKYIESLKMAMESLEENDKLKAEIERLMELMPKICETCEHEDTIGYEEPCNNCKNSKNWKLKSEVPE